MTIFDRFNIKVAAGLGMCGAAIALSPDAAATPLKTGGYACIQDQAGEAAAPLAGGPGAAGAPVAAGGVCTAGAPLTDMAGVPLAFPGPLAAPVPVAPVPIAPVPVVPVGAPLVALGGAPLAAGAPVDPLAPLIDMSGTGKGAPTGPAPTGGPVPGMPFRPGPAPAS